MARCFTRAGGSQQISVAENDTGHRDKLDIAFPVLSADLVSARPVHLAIIDGIATMAGGEGPWCGPQVGRK